MKTISITMFALVGLNLYSFDIVPKVTTVVLRLAKLSPEQFNNLKAVLVSEFVKRYNLTDSDQKKLIGNLKLNEAILRRLDEHTYQECAKNIIDKFKKTDEYQTLTSNVYKDEQASRNTKRQKTFFDGISELTELQLKKIALSKYLIAPNKELKLHRLDSEASYLRTLTEQILLQETIVSEAVIKQFLSGNITLKEASRELQHALLTAPKTRTKILSNLESGKIAIADIEAKDPFLTSNDKELLAIYKTNVLMGKIKLENINVHVFAKLLEYDDFREFVTNQLNIKLTLLVDELFMNIRDILKYDDIRSALIEHFKTLSPEIFEQIFEGTIGTYMLEYQDFQEYLLERAKKEPNLKNTSGFQCILKIRSGYMAKLKKERTNENDL